MLQKRISQRDAAKRLGVSRQTVVEWLRKGILPHFVIGGRKVLTSECLDEFETRAKREGSNA